eukprot:CAMPEP_0178912748 /NCGR_PEP_ID=MMETSP0786-20121207/10446_1 /TAXON_ID=186022 /ORGANISM="Thalassionema frauenfeldii, Strain CCMP 1798" /LENGTH=123 /DNA_ID=CAMNT_0020585387 /DNA_START=66 /DNA_END=437 /DNA_ORIENTATION=-
MIKRLMILTTLAFFAPLVSALTSGNPICDFCGVGGQISNPNGEFPIPEAYQALYGESTPCSTIWAGSQEGLIEEDDCVGLISETEIQSICGCEGGNNDSSSSKLLPTTITFLGVLSVFAGLIL